MKVLKYILFQLKGAENSTAQEHDPFCDSGSKFGSMDGILQFSQKYNNEMKGT